MTYTTISSHTGGNFWPSDYGTSGTLGIFCDRDFVADDGKSFQQGDGSDLTGRFVTTTSISVASNIPTYGAFTLPKTDVASPIDVRYFGIIFDANGVPRDSLFSGFHLVTSLGDAISFLAWWNDNQQKRRYPYDTNPTKTEMNLAIAAAINAPATTTQNGIGRASVNPTDSGSPVFIEENDPRVSISPGGSITGNRLQAANFDFSTILTTAVTTAGVRDPVDRELSFTFELDGGGTLAEAGIVIFFTYTNASGETLPSNIRGVAPKPGTKAVIASPIAETNATGWNVYAGSTFATASKQSGPIAIGTDFDLTALVAGAAVPTQNTTGGQHTVTVANASLIFAPIARVAALSPAKVYQALLIDEGTTDEEYVYVLAKSGSTFTASFSKTHSVSASVESATGGIQEVIMSLPAFGAPNEGGTVVIPSSTTIKAPVMLRPGLQLEGDASGPGVFEATGSTIEFASTNQAIGALMTTQYEGGATPISLRNLVVNSQTNALYSQGIMGGIGGFTVDHCLLQGDSAGTNFGVSGLRASFGTGFLRLLNSTIAGSPAINIYGAFLNSSIMENLLIVPRGEYIGTGNLARGIVIDAKAGPGGNGPAPGGEITMRHITTENGNGSLVDMMECNFIMEDFHVADWSPAAVPAVKYGVSTGAAISTCTIRDSVIGGANPSTATLQLYRDITFNAGANVQAVRIYATQLSPYGPVGVDAGGVAGPLIIRDSIVDIAATSGTLSIINRPTGGIQASGNGTSNDSRDGIFLDSTGLGYKNYKNLEQVLAAKVSVDLNTATPTLLFTCPSGYNALITKVIVYGPSSTASYSFGWNSPAFNDVIANATHPELTDAGVYTILIPKVGAARSLDVFSNKLFKVIMNTLLGSPGSVDMDILGYVQPI